MRRTREKKQLSTFVVVVVENYSSYLTVGTEKKKKNVSYIGGAARPTSLTNDEQPRSGVKKNQGEKMKSSGKL